jgi:hypothetical protein
LLAGLIRLGPRFRAAPARLEAAPGGALEPGQEPIVAQRPADALVGAQARERGGVRLPRGKQLGKIRGAFANRRTRRDPVVPAGEMRTRPRPAPVRCAADQTRARD